MRFIFLFTLVLAICQGCGQANSNPETPKGKIRESEANQLLVEQGHTQWMFYVDIEIDGLIRKLNECFKGCENVLDKPASQYFTNKLMDYSENYTELTWKTKGIDYLFYLYCPNEYKEILGKEYLNAGLLYLIDLVKGIPVDSERYVTLSSLLKRHGNDEDSAHKIHVILMRCFDVSNNWSFQRWLEREIIKRKYSTYRYR